eukprot:Opistho-2@36096
MAEGTPLASGDDALEFMQTFRRYKGCSTPIDYTSIVDFAAGSTGETDSRVFRVNIGGNGVGGAAAARQLPVLGCDEPHFGSSVPPMSPELDPRFWRAFGLQDAPGLVFIANPFSEEEQRQWVRRCLRDYTRDLAHSNLADPSLNGDAELCFFDREAAELNRVCHVRGRRKSALEKLRWTTLGFHYDWTRKVRCNTGMYHGGDITVSCWPPWFC